MKEKSVTCFPCRLRKAAKDLQHCFERRNHWGTKFFDCPMSSRFAAKKRHFDERHMHWQRKCWVTIEQICKIGELAKKQDATRKKCRGR